jgi:DNA processing protein
MKINKLLPQENNYLQIIDSIAKPPQALYYIGTLPIERQVSVAIVGTRKPSAYGREVAADLAEKLARAGAVVVSGLALGIDAIAHKAALDAGGTTIAVQANSLDKIYPYTNRSLGERIIANGGALISEYPEKTEPRPYQFLARNRIVSGISDYVVVVEAARRSGTLSTASHALEQGKELYAVPGNITNPLSAGCNSLINQGAMPVSDIDEFVNLVVPRQVNSSRQIALPVASTPLEAVVIELLQSGIRDGESLQEQSGASASDFNVALTMLEINGVIKPLGQNRWALRS